MIPRLIQAQGALIQGNYIYKTNSAHFTRFRAKFKYKVLNTDYNVGYSSSIKSFSKIHKYI